MKIFKTIKKTEQYQNLLSYMESFDDLNIALREEILDLSKERIKYTEKIKEMQQFCISEKDRLDRCIAGFKKWKKEFIERFEKELCPLTFESVLQNSRMLSIVMQDVRHYRDELDLLRRSSREESTSSRVFRQELQEKVLQYSKFSETVEQLCFQNGPFLSRLGEAVGAIAFEEQKPERTRNRKLQRKNLKGDKS